jgi:flagellar hook-length control protein FliK
VEEAAKTEQKTESLEAAPRATPGDAADPQVSTPARLSPNPVTRSGASSPQQAAHEPGQADRARFVERVARAFTAMGHRNGSVRLRISPPELGSLRLEITVRGGVLNARVEAETSAARNLLLDNLPVLRERLAQQDIKVEQFQVELGNRSAGGPPGQNPDHAEPRGSRANSQSTQPDLGAQETAPEEAPRAEPVRPGEGTQLNVVI